MQSTNTDSQSIDALWDYGQPAVSEARFRQLLAEVTNDTPLTIGVLTQIARAQGLQRQFEAAHQTLDQAQALLTDASSRAQIRLWLERGRVFNSSRQREAARPLFLQAWEEASASGDDFYAVDAAHMLGIVAPPDQQLVWNLKALALAEASPDLRTQKWLGSLYNNIGWTYHDLAQDERALAIFQKALAWRVDQGQVAEIRIARWSVARILRALQRTEEALGIQQSLYEALTQSGASDGYVEEELGECLLSLDRADAAQAYFAAAYQSLAADAWLVENEPDRLARLRTLGKIDDVPV